MSMTLSVPGLEQNYPYGLYQGGSNIPFGGLTVGPRVEGTQGVQPTPHIEAPSIGSVTGEDGNTPISLGTQGVGLGTTYAEGAGASYTNGLGHSLHTKWMVA